MNETNETNETIKVPVLEDRVFADQATADLVKAAPEPGAPGDELVPDYLGDGHTLWVRRLGPGVTLWSGPVTT